MCWFSSKYVYLNRNAIIILDCGKISISSKCRLKVYFLVLEYQTMIALSFKTKIRIETCTEVTYELYSLRKYCEV